MLQDIYNKSKKNFLFSDSKDFLELRDAIISNLDLSPKIKKNNESLKHLDPKVLEFSYNFKEISNEISYVDIKEENININVIDGKINNIHKDDKFSDKLEIKNINNKDNDAEKKILNFQKYHKDDYVINLNSLMLNSGYEINIKENQNIILNITNDISENDLTIFQKNIINCSKNSKVLIVEENAINRKSNQNTINYINIEKNSEVTHLLFQKNEIQANFQNTSYTNCYENSKYTQLTLNISKSSGRNHHYANLLGERSSANIDGIFLASNNQIIDNKTQINHNFPNCNSSQRYKGILTDEAKASYLSKTFVDKIAQKTEAYQLSKAILLSEESYFHSKPELKIFADDVKCSHGSTIGPIDQDLLFYLRSRGLSKKKSTSLLIKSFFHDIISDNNYKIFIDKFNIHSNTWLKNNNI